MNTVQIARFTIGLSNELSLMLTRFAGVSEVFFGMLFLYFYQSKLIVYTNIIALSALLLFVAIQLPEVLIEDFNPVTTNAQLNKGDTT